MKGTGLTIGQAARSVGLNPKTIRYYEEIGLLAAPRRSESGYRLYSRDEMERLRLVQRGKLLGLSLGEVREIARYVAQGHCHALHDHLQTLLQAKLEEIERRMRELAEFRDYLAGYLSKMASSPKTAQAERAPGAACSCLAAEKTLGLACAGHPER